MNLPKLINRVYFFLNRTRSKRYDIEQHILEGINIGIHTVIMDRYNDLKRSNRRYSFETFQRIKSELRTLVIRRSEIISTDNKTLTLPNDYWFDLGLIQVLNGKECESVNLSFNEEKESHNNSFQRPTIDDPRHMEYGNTLECQFGGGDINLNKGFLDYLKRFVPVSMQPESINLVVGGNYYVLTDGTIYNGKTYNEGDYFTAVVGFLTTSLPVRQYNECELPDHLHDEIAQRAAVAISGHAGDIEKLKYNQELAETK